MDLTTARQIIRTADEEMAALFVKRMQAAGEIAAYKAAHGLQIEDKAQEARVIEHCSALIEDDALRSCYVQFLKNTIEVSKRFQHRLMEGQRIACCGVEGSFAHIAAGRIFPDGQILSFPSFEEAFGAVEQGESDVAVLPVENSYAGEVGQVLDLMLSGNLFVNGVYDLPVTHHLLGIPGARLSDVETALSHPQALQQCREYLLQHRLDSRSAPNTAMAAKEVADLGDPKLCAIASEETAALYGLCILDRDINASRANTTRFAVFSAAKHTPAKREKGNAFILLFTVKDEAGGLAKAINIISAYNYNMRVLRSRPVKNQPWHYYFYAEVEGDDTSENGAQMVRALQGACPMAKVVGHYSAAENMQQGGKTI